MKLVKMVFRCMARRCKNKIEMTEAPAEQPLCPKCWFPMELISVSAKEARS